MKRSGKSCARLSGKQKIGGQVMKTEFNHAANDSPRSGSSKKVTPVIWAAIIVAIIAVVIWFGMHG
jgi:hypothetical protein